MKIKLTKQVEKSISQFHKNNLPIEGDEIVQIKCPICGKVYRHQGSEEDYKPYNKPCKHIILHIVYGFDEAIVDKGNIYKTAFLMNENIFGINVESIALALCKQKNPNMIIKRYGVHNACCGEISNDTNEFIVFSKE